MFHPDIPDFVLVSAIFFGAGIVKGVLGMGLPTFAMGFLGLLMPVPQAAGLLTLPSLVTNAWQSLAGGAFVETLRRLWPFLVAIAIGVAAAAVLPSQGDRTARALLGACLLLYGITGLAGWRLPPPSLRTQAIVGPLAGAVTGLITAWTGVFVLPAVPWLQALGLDRNRLAQALGLSFTVSTIALAVLLASSGRWGLSASLQSAFAILPALAGMWIGQLLRQEMGEAAFRRCFFGGLVLLGGWLAAVWMGSN